MSDVELARKLAAHPRFERSPGMRFVFTGPIDQCHVESIRCHAEGEEPGNPYGKDWSCAGWCEGEGYPLDWYTPDLSDPGTQGCMIDAMGVALVAVFHRPNDGDCGEKWTVVFDDAHGRRISRKGVTRGEALAAALIVTWGTA